MWGQCIKDVLENPEAHLRDAGKRNDTIGLRRVKRIVDLAAQFEKLAPVLGDKRFACRREDMHLCPDDATLSTAFDAHYLYHTAWAARLLAAAKPASHVDIGSCLRFVSLVSAFIPVDFYDYRPAALALSNLGSGQADLTRLPFADRSLLSLSCMHVVEHTGLGRYGDPIAPKGDLKAMSELQRVLAPGGSLYFVVPVGEPRIQFNAHRIYGCDQITGAFGELRLRSFSLVDDSGAFHDGCNPEAAHDLRYGCGCFHLQRERA